MPYTKERARAIGVKQYAEALADPASWQPEPGIVIRPFHQGDPQLFHVYSERDPEFGFCGERSDAVWAAHDLARRLRGSADA